MYICFMYICFMYICITTCFMYMLSNKLSFFFILGYFSKNVNIFTLNWQIPEKKNQSTEGKIFLS